ncbi:MAG TPA: hypothetical protein VFS43_11440, partial [Polyangiaceae bacterium]|nr:hypothetical protein [Polyangiaceae bacterium]
GAGGSGGAGGSVVEPPLVFPGETWATTTPEEAGLDGAALAALSTSLGGEGCIVRGGALAYCWGDPADDYGTVDAAGPIYTTLLFLAVQEGLIAGLDAPVVEAEPRLGEINAALGFKDKNLRWSHLATRTGGYGVAEPPGQAYVDSGLELALFFDTLVLNVYGATYETMNAEVLRKRLGDRLGFEDGPSLSASGAPEEIGRLTISIRDMARVGLLYLRRGRWADGQLVEERFAALPGNDRLPSDFPVTEGLASEVIAGQRSLGAPPAPGVTPDHDGSASWYWTANGVDRSGARRWPDAPADTYCALDGDEGVCVMPGLDLVVSFDDVALGGQASQNNIFAQIAKAVRP